jgi:hypothetical protein
VLFNDAVNCYDYTALVTDERISMEYGRNDTDSGKQENSKGGYALVTLPRTVTPYRDVVDGTRDHVTY